LDKKGITEYGEILYFFQLETQVIARLNGNIKLWIKRINFLNKNKREA
jgi:hypothetical protein